MFNSQLIFTCKLISLSGQLVDAGIQHPPGPWEIAAQPPSYFTGHKETIRVPYTSSVKVYQTCKQHSLLQILYRNHFFIKQSFLIMKLLVAFNFKKILKTFSKKKSNVRYIVNMVSCRILEM